MSLIPKAPSVRQSRLSKPVLYKELNNFHSTIPILDLEMSFFILQYRENPKKTPFRIYLRPNEKEVHKNELI